MTSFILRLPGRFFSLAVVMMAALSGSALAGSAEGSLAAKVVEEIKIQQLWGMDYGTFTPGPSGGTVKTRTGVSPNTVASGSVQLVRNGGPAAFQVDGAPNATFDISVSPSVTLTSGGDAMTSTLETISSGQLGNGTGFIFAVEGTLSVAPNQPSGTYRGTYVVNANYN